MTEPADGPAFYKIEQLLEQSVQPFPDLPAEAFDELCLTIKAQGLQNPILLTEDGFLYDGHQRCKALLRLGRKKVPAKDVRIVRGVSKANMLEHAYTSNIVRRHLTSGDKAAAMHQCVARGWSQRKIARTFGMTQPAVSQLLAAYPLATEEVPDVIITEGEDGKTYTRLPRDARPRPRPWAFEGVASKSVRKAYKFIKTEVPTGLDEWEKQTLAEQLDALREATDKFLDDMESM